MKVNQKLVIDLADPGAVPVAYAVQGDSGTRALEIELKANRAPWAIPEDATVMVYYRHSSDGSGGLYDSMPDGTRAWQINGNILTVLLVPQVCGIPGNVTMELVLKQGKNQLTTFRFVVRVSGNIGKLVDDRDYANLSAWLESSIGPALEEASDSADAAGQAKIRAEEAAASISSAASSCAASASEAAASKDAANEAASAAAASQTASEAAKQSAEAAAENAERAKNTAEAAEANAIAANDSAQSAQAAAANAAAKAQAAESSAQAVQTSAAQFAAEAKAAAANAQSAAAEMAGHNTSLGAHGDIRNDVDKVNAALAHIDQVVGVGINKFDAGNFATTTPSNWSINATLTSVTIIHKNTFSTGFPVNNLSLEPGEYVFHADYSQSSILFELQNGEKYVCQLTDGKRFSIEANNNYRIIFYTTDAGTYTVSDISIRSVCNNGFIQETGSRLNGIEHDVNELYSGTKMHDYQGFMDGTSEVNKVISKTGVISPAGTDNYAVVRYSVQPGARYKLTASANYGNALFAFYRDDNELVSVGTISAEGSEFTEYDDYIEIPDVASIMVVGYHVSKEPASLTGIVGKKVQKWYGKKWVCVGDSLTENNSTTTKHYFDYIAEETGIETVNMGVSGSGYARMSDSNNAFYQRISSCPSDADIVTIFGSFNDLGAGLPIGEHSDTGVETVAGCINTTIDNLISVIPDVRLGIVSPTPWKTTKPSFEGSAYQYVNVLEKICKVRSIPFLNLWYCSNLRPWDEDFRKLIYSKDGTDGIGGTHPNEDGHAIIAPKFEALLSSLLIG